MKNARRIFLVALCLFAIDGCNRSNRTPTARLHLFAWSEYIPQEVLDGFTKETGIPVDYEVYDSNEAMLAKLAPGSTEYDVIQPSEYALEHLIARKMLAPLDHSKLPNLANILPDYQNLRFDPGNQYSVPYMTGTVGILVNTAKVADPIRGFKDVFQPKYAHRIIVVNDNREIVSWALATSGLDINDASPANLAKVTPLLARWLPLVQIFNSDNPKAPLIQGDVDLGVVYSGDAAALVQQDPKFKYVLPIEGAHQFMDNLCIPAGSEHKEAAQAFINYILRPEVSKLISDKFPYTNPNGAARKLLTPEQLHNAASYPPAADRLQTFRDIGSENGDIADLMSRLRQEAARN